MFAYACHSFVYYELVFSPLRIRVLRWAGFRGFTLGRVYGLRWARRTSRGMLAAARAVGISALRAITYVTQRKKIGAVRCRYTLKGILRFALAK